MISDDFNRPKSLHIFMKLNYSKKITLGVATLNFIFVGALFYWFYPRANSIEDMNQRCNTKFIENNLVGKKLPDYAFVDKYETDMYQNLTQGKVLIIIFLTHCEACLKEFELLENHYSEINAEIKVVAVTGESARIVEQFLDEYKPNFLVYRDTQGGMMLKTQISCTPTLLFLENGIVRKVRVGITNKYQDLTEDF